MPGVILSAHGFRCGPKNFSLYFLVSISLFGYIIFVRRWIMKRYGDNVTCQDVFEAGSGNGQGENARLLFGGCGATYGSFPAPVKLPKTVETPKKYWFADLLPFLGFRRKKVSE
jgi:hypothetical protein